MATQTIYLNSDKTDYIVIKHGFNWKNLVINYMGNEIGHVADDKELKQGRTFQLDSDRSISVKLSGLLFPELEVLINGQYIKGSSSDPKVKLKQIYSITLILGLLNIIGGLLVELFSINFLESLGIGIGTVLTGGIMILLGLMVKKESLIALYLLIGLFVLDIILTFYFAAESEINPTSGLVLKVFIIIYLFKGIKAHGILKKEIAATQLTN